MEHHLNDAVSDNEFDLDVRVLSESLQSPLGFQTCSSEFESCDYCPPSQPETECGASCAGGISFCSC